MSVRPEEKAEMLADELPLLERALGAIEHVAYDDDDDDVAEALADLERGLKKLYAVIKRRRSQKVEG